MIVYRFEHIKSGLGPYRFGDQHGLTCECDLENSFWHDDSCEMYLLTRLAYDLNDAHRNEDHMATRGIDSDNVVGMTSLSALFEWFDGFIETLVEKGFVVSAYEAPSSRAQKFPQSQVGFSKHLSKRLTAMPISDKVDA